jgi:hypothetical protein
MKNSKQSATMEPAIEINSISLLLLEFYDGGQLFKYETCNFWGLFTSILNISPVYRGKVGNVIRNILLLRVRKDGIHQLQLRIAEMICLWEAIFPASESYFQLHQIMDLVSSIPSRFAMSRFATNLRIQFTEEQEADKAQRANEDDKDSRT